MICEQLSREEGREEWERQQDVSIKYLSSAHCFLWKHVEALYCQHL